MFDFQEYNRQEDLIHRAHMEKLVNGFISTDLLASLDAEGILINEIFSDEDEEE